MIKVGSLVNYVPNASATFKWQSYVNVDSRNPGIVLQELESAGTTTRRYKIRWHDGKITDEWVTYLEICDK